MTSFIKDQGWVATILHSATEVQLRLVDILLDLLNCCNRNKVIAIADYSNLDTDNNYLIIHLSTVLKYILVLSH